MAGIAFLALSQLSLAQFDHKVKFDNTGIWSHNSQQIVEGLTFATIVGGGLWEGGESRLGKTYWQSMDSIALGAAGSTAGKFIFTRSRPSQTDDPNKWFQGKGHYSFPSGEATYESAATTNFVLEYGDQYPAVYALELLPLYIGAARVKVQAHWQSDVLAGWALGIGSGYVAHQQDNPWFLSALPHGAQVGFKAQF
jgi:undecaprenyl-diphosphatase